MKGVGLKKTTLETVNGFLQTQNHTNIITDIMVTYLKHVK